MLSHLVVAATFIYFSNKIIYIYGKDCNIFALFRSKIRHQSQDEKSRIDFEVSLVGKPHAYIIHFLYFADLIDSSAIMKSIFDLIILTY